MSVPFPVLRKDALRADQYTYWGGEGVGGERGGSSVFESSVSAELLNFELPLGGGSCLSITIIGTFNLNGVR